MNYKTDGEFHTDLLELLARRMRPHTYVELGIGPDAATIRRVTPYCGRAIGVDLIKPAGDFSDFDFCLMETKTFFEVAAESCGPIDLAFIDADHSAEAARADFLGLLPLMVPDGIIAMHDTYPEDASYLDPGRCGDCWRTAANLLYDDAVCPVIEVLTLPCPPGLTLIRKLAGNYHLRWMGEK